MQTLTELVGREGALPEQDAVGWAIRLAKSVEQLHKLGVAHGGISSDCVLVEQRAYRASGAMADVRHAKGVAAYFSPERHAGRGISPADDTWAIAATLYWMLTASAPFPGGSEDQIRQRMSQGAPAPLAVFDVGDDELQRVLDRFLARNISQRIVRVAALRDALEKWHKDPEASTLPSLDESGDDSFAGYDDDDDEEIATVMRDFSDVRMQLQQMEARRSSPGAPPPAAGAPPPAAGAPPPAAGAPPPAAGAPPPAAGAPGAPRMRERATTEIGGFDAKGAPPGPRGPRPAAGAAAPRPAAGGPPDLPPLGSRPPPRPGAGPAVSSPQPGAIAGPALAPAPVSTDFDIDDDDSEEAATMLMDENDDMSAAIEAALERKRQQKAAAGGARPAAGPAPGPAAGGAALAAGAALPAAAPPGQHPSGPGGNGPPSIQIRASAPELAAPSPAAPVPAARPPVSSGIPGTSLAGPASGGIPVSAARPPSMSGSQFDPLFAGAMSADQIAAARRNEGRGLRIVLWLAMFMLVLVIAAVVALYLARRGVITLPPWVPMPPMGAPAAPPAPPPATPSR